MLSVFFIVPLLLTPSFAQLLGRVGPTTSYEDKAKNKTCDITDYSDDDGDWGPALQAAWNDCNIGGLVYIPPGEYPLKTFPELKKGQSSAIQLDGTITRSGAGDHYQMISVRDCVDFEFFSGNSKGAIQGYGYEYLKDGNYGPRLFRFENLENFSVHGFAAVDSPAYYFVFVNANNGEIYNIIVRGISSLGMTDGFDISGTNIWVHDVEITNGDECVTVKSPSTGFLIESIYCNLSGGTAIGSLGLNTNISNIHYKNLYLNKADGSYLKTNNGNGTVKNILWDNVIVHGGPYPLVINEGWGADRGGEGVQINNLTFKHWRGESGSSSRPVIRLECDADVPCYDITVDDVNLWTNDGDYVKWSCINAHGSGACLPEDDSVSTYATAVTVTKAPDHTAPTMAEDFSEGLPTTTVFEIPAVPTSFFPGATPISTLLDLDGAGGLVRRGMGRWYRISAPTQVV